MAKRGEDSGDEVERGERYVSDAVFDVVAEDPEKQHVRRQMGPAGVKEQRGDEREKDQLVGEEGGPFVAWPSLATCSIAAFVCVCHFGDGEGPSLLDLARNGRNFKVEPELVIDSKVARISTDNIDLAPAALGEDKRTNTQGHDDPGNKRGA